MYLVVLVLIWKGRVGERSARLGERDAAFGAENDARGENVSSTINRGLRLHRGSGRSAKEGESRAREVLLCEVVVLFPVGVTEFPAPTIKSWRNVGRSALHVYGQGKMIGAGTAGEVEFVDGKREKKRVRGDSKIEHRVAAGPNPTVRDGVENGQRLTVEEGGKVIGSGARRGAIPEIGVATIKVTQKEKRVRQGAGTLNNVEDRLVDVVSRSRIDVHRPYNEGHLVHAQLRERDHAAIRGTVEKTFEVAVMQFGVNVVDDAGGACTKGKGVRSEAAEVEGVDVVADFLFLFLLLFLALFFLVFIRNFGLNE